MALDEKALRRSDWSEGTTLTLADGQDWTFPRPVLRFFPMRTAEGRVTAAAKWSFDDTFQERFDALIESDDLGERLGIQIELAAGLLLKNYDLDDRALARLLPWIAGDKANGAMWQEIVQVLTGQSAPKPLPDGSASSS